MEKRKVLIIDDDKEFLELVRMNLEESGKFSVRIEDKGSAGLAAALAFKPDVILLDVVMGDESGTYVASSLKKNSETGNIPVIYVSGIVRQEDRGKIEGFLDGASVLAKPVGTERLISAIEETLGEK